MLNNIITLIIGLFGYYRITVKHALNEKDRIATSIETINNNHKEVEQDIATVTLKKQNAEVLSSLKEKIQRKNDRRPWFFGKSNNALIYERSELKREYDRLKTLSCKDSDCGLRSEIMDNLSNRMKILRDRLEDFNKTNYIVIKKNDVILCE